MGWLYNVQSRKSLIAERVAGFENENVRVTFERHCCVGNTLWKLTRIRRKDGSPDDVFIAVDLLQTYKQDGAQWWGYKDMDESCGPYQTSCPKSYVRACTEPINEWAREWRTKILGAAEVEERWPKKLTMATA